MDEIRYAKYHTLAKRIWQWAEKRHIHLFASYIASKENVETDMLSRLKNIDAEWELNNWAFEKIAKILGLRDCDLFASKINAKCKKFITRFPEQGAIEVDAFTINWHGIYFYAFPSFAQILKALVK